MTTCRLFVGGLVEGTRSDAIQRKFQLFGRAQDVDVHVKRDSEGHIMKTFAYVNFTGDHRKCVMSLNGVRWGGGVLKVQVAKESFTDRLKREQAENAKSAERSRDRLEPSNKVDRLVPKQPVSNKVDRLVPKQPVSNKVDRLVPKQPVKQQGRSKAVVRSPGGAVVEKGLTPSKTEKPKPSSTEQSLPTSSSGTSARPAVVEFSDSDDWMGRTGGRGGESDSGEGTDDMLSRMRASQTDRKSSPSKSKHRPARRQSSAYVSPSSSEEEEEGQENWGAKRSKQGHKKKATVKPGDSDSESDVPDVEGWVHNKHVTSSTPALNSTPAPTQSTPVPSNTTPKTSHEKKVKNSQSQDKNKKNKDLSSSGQLNGVHQGVVKTKSPRMLDNRGSDKAVGGAVSDSKVSVRQSELTAPQSSGHSRQNTQSAPSRPLTSVPSTLLTGEFGTGLGKTQVQSSGSSSEGEDLLDCIAAGKIHKLKQIQRENHLKQRARHGKRGGEGGEKGHSPGTGDVTGGEVNSARQAGVGHTGATDAMATGTTATQATDTAAKHKLSNTQRLQSVKERQRQTALQRSAVQRALAGGVAGEKNKKIVFDSDSSADEKQSPQETQQVAQRPPLFDGSLSSDSGAEVDSDTERFRLKPQFEGKKGNKLMKLQTRFKGDERFRFDGRFEESASEGEEEGEADPGTTEQQRSLRVLESVVGKKLKKMRSKSQDLVGVHYDPSRVDHQQFEIQKPAEPRPKKKKPRPAVTEDVPSTDQVPEVSKEKFFEVRTSLKHIFSKHTNSEEAIQTGEDKDTDTQPDTQPDKPFSLLERFGAPQGESGDPQRGEDAEPHATDIPPAKRFPWQQDGYESSGEEDTVEARANPKQPEVDVAVTTSRQTFFFTANDPRLQDGLVFFCRPAPLDTLREAWTEKRPGLVEAYRLRRKRSLRKSRTAHVFQSRLNKRRKFNNLKK